MSIPTVPAGTDPSEATYSVGCAAKTRTRHRWLTKRKEAEAAASLGARLLGRGFASHAVTAIAYMTRGMPNRRAVPVNGRIIRPLMVKQGRENRVVAVPEQADSLIIQAIYR
jgi:hypothetical protein